MVVSEAVNAACTCWPRRDTAVDVDGPSASSDTRTFVERVSFSDPARPWYGSSVIKYVPDSARTGTEIVSPVVPAGTVELLTTFFPDGAITLAVTWPENVLSLTPRERSAPGTPSNSASMFCPKRVLVAETALPVGDRVPADTGKDAVSRSAPTASPAGLKTTVYVPETVSVGLSHSTFAPPPTLEFAIDFPSGSLIWNETLLPSKPVATIPSDGRCPATAEKCATPIWPGRPIAKSTAAPSGSTTPAFTYVEPVTVRLPVPESIVSATSRYAPLCGRESTFSRASDNAFA